MKKVTAMAVTEVTTAYIQRQNRLLARVRRHGLLVIGLVLSDAILINIAFTIAYWIRYQQQWFRAVPAAYLVPFSAFAPFVLILTGLLILIYQRGELYRLRWGRSWFDEMYAIISGTTTGVVMMMVLVFVLRSVFYSRLIFFYGGILIVVLLGLSRLIKSIVVRHMRQQGIGVTRAIIVGAGEVGHAVMRTMIAHRELGYKIVGFVDDEPARGNTDIGRFKGLGRLENLPYLIQDESIDEVIVTLPWQYHRQIMAVMTSCEAENVEVRIVPDLFQMTLSRMSLAEIAGIPMIGFKRTSSNGIRRLMKRVTDVTLSWVLIIVGAPLMGLIALMIKLDSPGSVIFGQKRVGKGGKHFTCFKFRSMVADANARREFLRNLNEADGPLFKIRNDPRLTRVGRWLRRFSLDELPQLYNVLRGDMSLVGPRPPLPEEVAQYQPWHLRRLGVMPGMTGLWQVSGRSRLPFDEMVLLDIYYAEHWSLALDLKILLRTIPKVIFGEGAY